MVIAELRGGEITKVVKPMDLATTSKCTEHEVCTSIL